MDSEGKQQFSAFEKYTEFAYHLDEILTVDEAIEPDAEENRQETSHLEKLIMIVRAKDVNLQERT